MPQEFNPFSELRKESLDIYNRLHSIQEDVSFVNTIHEAYPNLPLIRQSSSSFSRSRLPKTFECSKSTMWSMVHRSSDSQSCTILNSRSTRILRRVTVGDQRPCLLQIHRRPQQQLGFQSASLEPTSPFCRLRVLRVRSAISRKSAILLNSDTGLSSLTQRGLESDSPTPSQRQFQSGAQ